MFRNLLLLVYIVFLFQISILNADELEIDCEYYWNPDSLVKIPESKPLQFYIDSAFIISPKYKDFLDDQKRSRKSFENNIRNHIDTLLYPRSYIDKEIISHVDTIGEIANHLIVDILFELIPVDYQNELGKITLMSETDGKFRLLFVFLGYPGCYKPENSIIVSSDTIDILYTKSRYYGQLTQYSEKYWVYNKNNNCFNIFNIKSTVKDLANELVPDSCRYGSGVFNIDSLFWYSSVGKEGDHYRWPSCGRIKFWLKFIGCELIVDKSIYDPDDIALH